MSSGGRGGGRGPTGNSSQAQGKPVGLPPTVERPDQPIRSEQTAASFFAVAVARPLWLRRRELACVAVVAVFALVGRGWAGYPGLVAGAAPIVGTLAVPAARRRVSSGLRRGRLIREWDSAARHAGLATGSDRVPRIVGPVVYRDTGQTFRVRIPKGATAADLEESGEAVAVVLDARGVAVTRDPRSARYATVTIQRVDPFEGRAPDPWPWIDAPRADFGGRLPVGVDETGTPVGVTMLGKNIMLGGEPEAGKSVAASQFIAAGALDPTVKIWGWDAKLVELALWEPVLQRVAYNDIDDAISQLRELVERMDKRYVSMQGAGRRTASAADGPIYLAVFDELRFYTAHEDSKKKKEFCGLLVDLIARGRAARFVTLAATQKPSTDVVPSAIRDLVGYRWALRCTTKDASDTILGAGWAQEGYSAADISIGTRGVGLLHAEGGYPMKVRSHYLSDADIAAIAARGAALRRAA